MSKTTSINPNDLTQPERHKLLLTAVAPRPICFASTVDVEGNVNLSPFSFFNVFSSSPPVMVFSPARSGRDGTLKHTLQNIYDVPEVVINVVNYGIVEQMSLSSTAYDKGVNEFIKAGLQQIPSDHIKPPRVGEAPVAFECTVDQVIELGDNGGAGNLVIAKVVMIHVNDEYLDEAGNLDTQKLDLVARMGGNWYCRANGDAIFEIPKPLRTKGIGVDGLPEYVRNSPVLTGNDLGRLGTIDALPDQADIDNCKSSPQLSKILQSALSQSEQLTKVHSLAQQELAQGDILKALGILMSIAW
jgi:flavin reductase (DIM6/NTAB) family NADH-FMN oxidoreductase RutF